MLFEPTVPHQQARRFVALASNRQGLNGQPHQRHIAICSTCSGSIIASKKYEGIPHFPIQCREIYSR